MGPLFLESNIILILTNTVQGIGRRAYVWLKYVYSGLSWIAIIALHFFGFFFVIFLYKRNVRGWINLNKTKKGKKKDLMALLLLLLSMFELAIGRLLVFVQVWLEGERFVTGGTSETLGSRMRLHVSPQIGAIGEGLAAPFAAVGFLTGVRPDVTL